jgi:hypothetical protein
VASRLLARAVPLALGAVAAGVWLHRRQLQRPQLREVTGELPPKVPPARPTARSIPRFMRVRRRPIDIVTIVDDLLGAAR